MKRILIRFSMLAVLVATGSFLYLETPADASMVQLGCWEQAYGKWLACDGAHSNTTSNFMNVDPNNNYVYCMNNSASACSASASSFCSSQANASCSGNSNFPACYNSAYNGCYGSTYDACQTQTYNTCATNVTNSYNNRAFAYSSCMGSENTGASCVEQVAGTCDNARTRAAECASLYTDDMDSRSTCLYQSGVHMCE